MKTIINRSMICALALACQAGIARADVWSYSWDRNATGFNTTNAPGGNDAGGYWLSASFTQDTVTNILTGSVTLDVSSNNTDALWLAITNGPSPSGLGSDYAALYMANGSYFVAPDANDPTSSHTITSSNVITTGTYSTSQVGNEKTFSFSVDTAAVNNWSGAPSNWKGIGFPFDAQGNTGGDQWTPYRWGGWFRSFADGSVSVTSGGGGYGWNVTWGSAPDYNVGMWDLDGVTPTLTPAPEPNAALLAALPLSFLLLRRSRLRE